MQDINNVVTNLNQMYDYFNTAFHAELPKDVVFTLIPNKSTRGRYLGWFASNRWMHDKDTIHEVNITPDFLNRSVDDIAETLIHEITHLKNFIGGIVDCNSQQYHNKKFQKQAQLFGLKAEKMRNKGYALTSLDEKAKEIVNAYKTEVLKGNNPFVIHRITTVKPTKFNPKKSVAIDRGLADELVELNGGKLSHIVDQALREYIEKKA